MRITAFCGSLYFGHMPFGGCPNEVASVMMARKIEQGYEEISREVFSSI